MTETTWRLEPEGDGAWKLTPVEGGQAGGAPITVSLNGSASLSGVATSPLIVRGREVKSAGETETETIGEGAILALDEKFSLALGELPEGTGLKINGEDKDRNYFEQKFCRENRASDSGDNEDAEWDVVRDTAFGLYRIEIDQRPPLDIEIYPGQKVGYFESEQNKRDDVSSRYQKCQEFFHAMEKKILDQSPNFVFSLRDPAAVAEGKGPSPSSTSRSREEKRTEMTEFLFFASRAERIIDAVRQIRRSPHRILGRQGILLRIDQATCYDGNACREIIARPQHLQPVRQGGGLATVGGKGYLPERIVHSIHQETCDNAENRFVLHVAKVFMKGIGRAIDYAGKNCGQDGKSGKDIVNGLQNARRSLLSFMKDRDFISIGSSSFQPDQSKALSEKMGYRQILRIWIDYGGLKGEGAISHVADLIRLKKYHELYELWCYLFLVEKASGGQGIKGIPVEIVEEEKEGKTKYLKSIYRGNEVTIKCQHEIEGTELRPDFILESKSNGTSTTKFYADAKFRNEPEEKFKNLREANSANNACKEICKYINNENMTTCLLLLFLKGKIENRISIFEDSGTYDLNLCKKTRLLSAIASPLEKSVASGFPCADKCNTNSSCPYKNLFQLIKNTS